jgi:hypothetical protein
MSARWNASDNLRGIGAFMEKNSITTSSSTADGSLSLAFSRALIAGLKGLLENGPPSQ